MKMAILADVHGNIDALEAVLSAAHESGAERVVNLGDVVGYGADPGACLHRLAETEAVAILGNHDQAIVEPGQIRAFSDGARQTLAATLELLTPDAFEYLARAALRRAEHEAVFSHANPVEPEEWELLFTYEQVRWCMDRLDWQVGFFGHTHHPVIYCQMEGRVVRLTSTTVAIGSHRYLINPGSVGQPRDGDCRAAYAIWDVGGRYVELRRVEYPIARAQARIAEAGWPAYQAERLARGE